MGFFTKLAGALFGWSDAAKGRYQARTQKEIDSHKAYLERQKTLLSDQLKANQHERAKDLRKLESALENEKLRILEQLKSLEQERLLKKESKLQELTQQDLEFRKELVTNFIKIVHNIQSDHLAKISSLILGYKSEHTSAIKELETFYEDKVRNLRKEVVEYRDIPEVYEISLIDLKNLVKRKDKLINKLIGRVEKDIDVMQKYVLDYDKNKGLKINELIDNVIGPVLLPEDRNRLKAKISSEIEDIEYKEVD